MMKLTFTGCEEAELFTQELSHSLAGVLAKNYIPDESRGEPGFVFASVDRRFWYDTMWTRDAGTFLREMAHWGCLEQGVQTVRCLFRHVLPNEKGYRMFPMYFKPGEAAAGSELDGTAAIIIGAILLWERLPQEHPARREIWSYLTGADSPLRGLLAALENQLLVAGSGEFGGGCGIEGEFYNVVQNNLVRLALLAGVHMVMSQAVWAEGSRELIEKCTTAARTVLRGMLSHLRHPDGTWMWCRRAPDFSIDWSVLEHEINQGFGGINGVLSMTADVLGFLPGARSAAGSAEPWLNSSVLTFLQLLNCPQRMRQFTQYGIWTQFDRFWGGYLTGPSYGHGYALQCMLLMDWQDLYTPAANWLARATYQTLPGQVLHRDNPYQFYERYYSPEAVGRVELEEGCGALNLVCVMEPLKVARLMLGVDDHDPEHIRIIPRLPRGWTHLEAQGVPLLTPGGLATVDIRVSASPEGKITRVDLSAGDLHVASGRLPLRARLGTVRQPRWVTPLAAPSRKGT